MTGQTEGPQVPTQNEAQTITHESLISQLPDKPDFVDIHTWKALCWLHVYGPELINEKEFERLTPLIRALHYSIDNDLDNDGDHVLTAIAPHICEVSGVEPDRANDLLTEGILEAVDSSRKKRDPTKQWWRKLIRESELKDKGSLAERGGRWLISLYPDKKSETHGAEELQQIAAQFSLELMQNLSEQADRPLHGHPNPPSVEGRTKLKEDVEARLAEASTGGAIYQNANHLSEIKTPVSISNPNRPASTHTHDATAYLEDGKTFYRDLDTFNDATVRIFKQGRDVNEGYYCDMPLHIFRDCRTSIVELQMRDRFNDLHKDERFNWTRIDNKKAPEKNTKLVMSVSSGPGTNPNGLIHKYSREGLSIMHAHYNTEQDSADLYFNHVSFDGSSGKEVAFGIGYALQAGKGEREEWLEQFKNQPYVEWNPRNHEDEIPTDKELLKIEQQLLNADDSDPDVFRSRAFRKYQSLIRALGLDDVLITPGPIEGEDAATISEAVNILNQVFYYPKIDDLDQFIEQNSNEEFPLDNDDMKALRRFVAIKFNSQRFGNMVMEQYNGSSTSCVKPENGRLSLSLIPEIDSMSESFDQIFPKWSKSAEGFVFLQPILDAWKKSQDIEKVHEIQEEVLSKLKKFYDIWTAENGLAMLSISPLSALESASDKWRSLTEKLGALTSRAWLYKTFIKAQNSDIASFTRTINGVEVELNRFGSAITSRKREKQFAASYGSMTQVIDGKLIIKPTARFDLSPEFFNSLALNPNDRFLEHLKRVYKDLAPTFPQYRLSQRDDLFNAISSILIMIKKEPGVLNAKGRTIDNSVLLCRILREKAFKGNFTRELYLTALKIIIITGLTILVDDDRKAEIEAAADLPVFVTAATARIEPTKQVVFSNNIPPRIEQKMKDTPKSFLGYPTN